MSGLVLLLEDELAILDFLTRALEQEGHLVASATDGVQGERLALARAAEKHFSAVARREKLFGLSPKYGERYASRRGGYHEV